MISKFQESSEGHKGTCVHPPGLLGAVLLHPHATGPSHCSDGASPMLVGAVLIPLHLSSSSLIQPRPALGSVIVIASESCCPRSQLDLITDTARPKFFLLGLLEVSSQDLRLKGWHGATILITAHGNSHFPSEVKAIFPSELSVGSGTAINKSSWAATWLCTCLNLLKVKALQKDREKSVGFRAFYALENYFGSLWGKDAHRWTPQLSLLLRMMLCMMLCVNSSLEGRTWAVMKLLLCELWSPQAGEGQCVDRAKHHETLSKIAIFRSRFYLTAWKRSWCASPEHVRFFVLGHL